jgi:hypothetical protein
MAIPTKDTLLLNWSTNFNTRGTATPTTLGLTAAQMTAYTPLHDGFVAAYNAMNILGARSKSLVSAKNTAKAALLVYARQLYGFVQANADVSNADKDLLGVTVRAQPSPIPAPIDAPQMDIVSVVGRTVSVRLHSATTQGKRGKPAGVKGAAVFSYVGATPPTDPSVYKFEGTTTRTTFDIVFPDSAEPGTTVWVTAMWFNERAQSGPACTPMSTVIQYGMSQMQQQSNMSIAA